VISMNLKEYFQQVAFDFHFYQEYYSKFHVGLISSGTVKQYWLAFHFIMLLICLSLGLMD